ncbi:hypothetical protein DYB32_004229 [Aphanomyces invadans]|uniref:Fibronectin type-III domain-containing protein n=1 Tax=Aphanomyces invadans TaxID=157072 RepID=A0A3R6Y9Y4_9STRA|nr:hypothetical protein DYB32_004229 [Aphanomyces invadans]
MKVGPSHWVSTRRQIQVRCFVQIFRSYNLFLLGGSRILHYRVYAAVNNSILFDEVAITPVPTITLYELESGVPFTTDTVYEFRVVAENVAGMCFPPGDTSFLSESLGVTFPAPSLPPAILPPYVMQAGASTLALQVVLPDDMYGTSTVWGYVVQWNTPFDAPNTFPRATYVPLADFNSYQFVLRQLHASTSYNVRVSLFTELGYTVFSRYKVYIVAVMLDDTPFQPSELVDLNMSEGTVQTQITGLVPLTSYNGSIVVRNEFDLYSTVVESFALTTSSASAPWTPQRMFVFAATGGMLQFTWSPPANEGGAGKVTYFVEHSKDGKTSTLCTNTTTSCRAFGLSFSTAYIVSVRAQNDLGSSPPTSLQSFSTTFVERNDSFMHLHGWY